MWVPTDLTGVDAKIERANEHIEDLQGHIEAFEATDPYEMVVQDDPQDAKRYQGILKIHKPIPLCIPLTTGDAIHNLRAALDHLACAAVSEVTPNTAFPIWRSSATPKAKDYRSLVLGKVRGAPKPFINLLLGLQPYEGGNHEALWALDYLDITDKHKLLIEALTSYDKIIQYAGPFAMVIKPDYEFPLKDGDELFGGLYANREKDPDVTIEVALGEPSILVGEPVVPALTDLVQAATAIIDELRKVL